MSRTIDTVEVVNTWILQCRAITTDENGKTTYDRWCLTPDMDISDQEQKVKDIANAAWTPEVRQAYETFKAEQAARMTP
jgi:hypothetical protein